MSSTAAMQGNSAHYGYALSVILHVAVISIAWAGLPFIKRDLPKETLLVIDLVEIAEITQATPEPQAETEPLDVPLPSSEETALPYDKNASTNEVVDVTPQKIKPKLKPKPPPTKQDDIAFLKKLVKDLDAQQELQIKPQAEDPDNRETSNNYAGVASDKPTISELDVIRRHIEDHWRIDPGKEGVDELAVEIKINLSLDGTVQEAQIVDSSRYFLDTTFRTFANSARNAVMAASPLPINPNKAGAFREMILKFSPQGRIN